ncbi:MAG: DUF3052 family protein [Phycisphaerales bacterium]|nr:DUF3052 family protein [Phycisphaerales bacterium]
MARVLYIHWHESEAVARARPLVRAGHDVRICGSVREGSGLAKEPTDVLVVSLDRLPAHGREVAAWWWQAKKRQHIPIVFEGGKEEKVLAIRDLMPTAVFCGTGEIAGAVQQVLRHPPPPPAGKPPTGNPVSQPLVVKLGIKPGMRVCLLGAPRGYVKALDLPKGTNTSSRLVKDPDLVQVFATDLTALRRRFLTIRKAIGNHGAVWVSWPKQTSGVDTDINANLVRELAFGHGLVDNKICAVDETWSAMRLAPRRAPR